jgi:hypothetical protein
VNIVAYFLPASRHLHITFRLFSVPLPIPGHLLGSCLALHCSRLGYAVLVKKHVVVLRQIRSKILRIRQLSRALVAAGGDAQDIVPCLLHFNDLLRRQQLRAAEQELDTILVRVQQKKTALHDWEKSAA